MQWSELGLRVRRTFGRVLQLSRVIPRKKVALQYIDLVVLERVGSGRLAADAPRSTRQCRGRITISFNNGEVPGAVALIGHRMSNAKALTPSSDPSKETYRRTASYVLGGLGIRMAAQVALCELLRM